VKWQLQRERVFDGYSCFFIIIYIYIKYTKFKNQYHQFLKRVYLIYYCAFIIFFLFSISLTTALNIHLNNVLIPNIQFSFVQLMLIHLFFSIFDADSFHVISPKNK